MYWPSLEIRIKKKKTLEENLKGFTSFQIPEMLEMLDILLSECIKTCSLTRTPVCNANTLIQGFCITHNSMPILSSHPSGTNASPTRSAGAFGGRRQVPAVPAHLSQPSSCCAKPQLSGSNWPHRLGERNAPSTHSQLWWVYRHKIVLSGMSVCCPKNPLVPTPHPRSRDSQEKSIVVTTSIPICANIQGNCYL